MFPGSRSQVVVLLGAVRSFVPAPLEDEAAGLQTAQDSTMCIREAEQAGAHDRELFARQ